MVILMTLENQLTIVIKLSLKKYLIMLKMI
nr:MAG TPA: hypothetical protein [Bacteriophage sp.]